MDRVAVPFWLDILSDQLPVIGLVGFYPTNNLIGRRLIPKRPKSFPTRPNTAFKKYCGFLNLCSLKAKLDFAGVSRINYPFG